MFPVRRSVLFVSLLLSLPATALAQGSAPAQTPAPCPPVRDANGNLVTPATCDANTPKAPAAQRFPYPGEAPADTAPTAPAAQSPPSATQPAGKRFPYPGESDSDTPAAASPAAKTPLQDAGSSGESSSSGSDSSSSNATPAVNDPDANDPAAIPRRDRHRPPPGPRQTPSQREQEDVQVAGFYFNDGNFKGSYDRAMDAVSLDSEDAEAQLLLGNAARKLGKLDEAEAAYKKCLDLDPVPKVRKAAERATREMTGR